MSNVICPKCGNTVQEGKNFCNKCGTRINSNVSEVQFFALENKRAKKIITEAKPNATKAKSKEWFAKYKKKIIIISSSVLSALVAIVVILVGVLVPIEASIEGYSVSVLPDGSVELLKYKGKETEIVIPSEIFVLGKKRPVTSIGYEAFYNCSSLKSVVIPNSVTSIEDRAFEDCSTLTSVVIPDSVTSIGEYAFYRCSSLTGIEIPNSVKSIGESSFSNCSSLTSVVIPDSVTSIGEYAFYRCSSLTDIEIPNSVTSIGKSAFRDCRSLQSITVPFVGNGNDETHFGYIFGASDYFDNDDYVPTSLKLVTITGGDSIGNFAFCGCGSLTSIEIPNSVTIIGESSFSNCSSITSVVIPKSVTSIGNSAFRGCSSLQSITIPFVGNGNYETHFGYIFGASSYYGNNNYVPTSLKSVTITGGDSIGNSAFRGCSSLTSIVIPNSVTEMGTYAFYGCSSLTSIVIPKSVTSIGNYTFYNCSSLASVIISKSVTSIGESAFQYCSSLTSVVIPASITSIGDQSFFGCYKLIEVYNLSSLRITIGSTNYGHVGCYALDVYTSLDTPNKLFTDSNGYVIYVDGEEIILVGYLGTEMELTLRNGITSIYKHAFFGCSSLTSVVIPDSVTSIGYKAFDDCSSLTSVVIPDSVTSIGYDAFLGCSSLTIYCEAESKPSGWNSWWNYDARPVVWGYEG